MMLPRSTEPLRLHNFSTMPTRSFGMKRTPSDKSTARSTRTRIAPAARMPGLRWRAASYDDSFAVGVTGDGSIVPEAGAAAVIEGAILITLKRAVAQPYHGFPTRGVL